MKADLMPQPYTPRPEAKLEGGFAAIDQRPACALKIGRIVAAWADVEFFLTMVAGDARAQVHWVDQNGPGSASGQLDVVNMKIMDALESLNARLNVVRAILKLTVPDELSDQFDELASEIRKIAIARNQIVHSRWDISDAYPYDILKPTGSMVPRYQRYTENDLENNITRIRALADKTHLFATNCFHHHVYIARSRLEAR